MRERRTHHDQVALEALWQTRVVIDEICNSNWIERVEEADFAFVRVAFDTGLVSLLTVSLFLQRETETRFAKTTRKITSNGEKGDLHVALENQCCI